MGRKIFFQNSAGLKICGILEQSRKEHIAVLVHGYSSNKNATSTADLAKELKKKEIDSLRIDLDGCGESEGRFEDQTISSASDDISSAIKYLKKIGYHKISLFGSSAGGLAVMVASLHHPELHKIALKAPVSDFPSVFLKSKAWKLGSRSLADWKKRGYALYTSSKTNQTFKIPYSFYVDTAKYVMYSLVKRILCPVLIIHGDADESVPISQSKRVIKQFPQGTLIILKNADHALAIKGDRTESVRLFADWFQF